MSLRRLAAAGAIAAGVLVPATAADAAPVMRLGFNDTNGIQRFADERPLALEHLKATRATTLRLPFDWDKIEKAQPTDPAQQLDPAWSGYDWTDADSILRDVAAAGVDPLVEFLTAPAWWEGPNRPAVSDTAPRGTWRPDPAAFARFSTAAAKRYSGTYPDPLRPGQPLPKVTFWEIWNEPNLPDFLSPQWSRRGKHWVAESPRWYKKMLNAAYDGIKSVAPDSRIIAGATAPYGEPWLGGRRMPPARFWRTLLCINGRARLKAANCRATPVKFDIASHHPYPIGPPGRHAINADDIVIPDFAKLTKPLKLAIASRNVFPRGRKPIWATEMSWDSNPPDPDGIPAALQAQYAAGSIYVLWRQGVRAMLWWNMRDDPVGRGYEYGLQSGVYLRGATVAQDVAKPAVRAFRFPFVSYRAYRDFKGVGASRLWGLAPRPGLVAIQRLKGRTWKTIRVVKADRGHVFQTRLGLAKGTRVRAVQDGEISVGAKVF